MRETTKMENNAITGLISKPVLEKSDKLGIPRLFILHLYHGNNRPRNFGKMYADALDNIEKSIEEINEVIETNENVIEKYRELKLSILMHDIKKGSDN